MIRSPARDHGSRVESTLAQDRHRNDPMREPYRVGGVLTFLYLYCLAMCFALVYSP